MYNNKIQNIAVIDCSYFSPFCMCMSQKQVTRNDSAVFLNTSRCVQTVA